MTEPLVVFADANVVAKPVTRSLLMMGGPASGFLAVWSELVEQQSNDQNLWMVLGEVTCGGAPSRG